MHVLLFSYELGPSGHTGGFRWNHLIREMTQTGWSFDVVTSTTSFAASHGVSYGRQVALHPVSPDWPGRSIRRQAARMRAKQPPAKGGGPESEAATLQVADARQAPGLRQRLGAMAWGSYEALDGYVWARRAGRRGSELAAERRPGVIVATLPEWLVPMAGLHAARHAKVPLVLDLRDPWYFGRGDYASMLNDAERRVWRRSEIRATRGAALIVDNTSRAMVAAGRAIAAHARTPRVAITNAHPMVDAPGLPDPATFIVSFVGYLYPFMDPRPLLAACGRLRLRRALTPRTFAVRFVGTGDRFNGISLTSLAATCGLDGIFSAEDRVAATTSEEVMQASSALVVFDFPHGLQTPSKFYHYAQMRGRIIALAGRDSALADAAHAIGVEPVPNGDEQALDKALDAAHAAWKASDFRNSTQRKEAFVTSKTARQMDEALRGVILNHGDDGSRPLATP